MKFQVQSSYPKFRLWTKWSLSSTFWRNQNLTQNLKLNYLISCRPKWKLVHCKRWKKTISQCCLVTPPCGSRKDSPTNNTEEIRSSERIRWCLKSRMLSSLPLILNNDRHITVQSILGLPYKYVWSGLDMTLWIHLLVLKTFQSIFKIRLQIQWMNKYFLT